jgi:hypothetical protein
MALSAELSTTRRLASGRGGPGEKAWPVPRRNGPAREMEAALSRKPAQLRVAQLQLLDVEYLESSGQNAFALAGETLGLCTWGRQDEVDVANPDSVGLGVSIIFNE